MEDRIEVEFDFQGGWYRSTKERLIGAALAPKDIAPSCGAGMAPAAKLTSHCGPYIELTAIRLKSCGDYALNVQLTDIEQPILL